VSVFLQQNITYLNRLLPSDLFWQMAQSQKLHHNFHQSIRFHNRWDY